MANDEESSIGIPLVHLDGTGTQINDINEQPRYLAPHARVGSNESSNGVNGRGLRPHSVLSHSASLVGRLRSRTGISHISIISGHDGNGGVRGLIKRITGATETEVQVETDADVTAAREDHFRLILDTEDDSFVEWDHYKWYFKFLECRFICGWEILRGSLRGLNELAPDPEPGEFAVVYRAMAIVARVFMETERCALSDIVDKLMHLNTLREFQERDHDRALPNRMAFAMIGWLTMLFEPDLHPPRGQIAIQRLNDATSHRRSRTRTISQYTQDFGHVEQPLHILLNHFGSLVPEIKLDACRETELITVSNVCFSVLANVASVEIEWVNSLALHLEFDNVRKRLKVFRFPSLCRLLCQDSRLLSRLYADHAHAYRLPHGLDPASPVGAADYFREVLLSYRLLFGQDKKSWKAFLAASAAWPAHWPRSSPNALDDADPLLQTLCGTSATSPAARALYAEIDAEDASPYYYPDSFPFLGRRILDLQTFVKGRHPTNWRALWSDRRNVAYWWTFWAVLFIGGGTIALGVLQLAFSVWQALTSQQQVDQGEAAVAE